MNRTKLLTAIMVVTWGFFSFNTLIAQTAESSDKSDAKPTTTTKAKVTPVSKTTPATKATPATPAQPAKKSVTTTTKKATPATPATPAKPAVKPTTTNKPATITRDITGYWLTAQKGSIVEFVKSGDEYTGKVAWSRTAKDKAGKPLKDVKNPDKSKRNNPIVGSAMITGLKYNPKTDTYEGGKIYQAQTGRSYNCKVTLDKNKNVMKIVGGVGFISKTLTWTRTTGIPGK